MDNRNVSLATTKTEETVNKTVELATKKEETGKTIVVIEFNNVDLSEKRYFLDGSLEIEVALSHKKVLKLVNVNLDREEYILVGRINRLWLA
ncbi:hypothetical protein QUF99_02130 [Bacillus sp. DX4.1]|uniref:hypothetical protein n=1 Tax=Bacillus sp. DX4.1 TaxID=3055867 RepID=UPI0025A09A64|nr:hypothetical protein [Bacillus sp. DX4.1]MDM5186255.1 hypothetical protein [Bacillus sp. DX4.1]